MSTTWLVEPDGGYKKVDPIEDLLSDARSMVEDAVAVVQDFQAVREQSQAATEEARNLVRASKRERRLRSTNLRLVKTS